MCTCVWDIEKEGGDSCMGEDSSQVTERKPLFSTVSRPHACFDLAVVGWL